MKTLLLLALATIGFNANAAQLTKPFKLKLVSADGKIDFSKQQALLTVRCYYKKFTIGGSIFDPGTPGVHQVPCGNYQEQLVINSNNEVEVPAIKSTAEKKSDKLENLQVEIHVFENIPGQYASNPAVTLKASGKKVIEQLVNNKMPVNFYSASIADLNVSYEGSDFFGSELTQVPGADLLLTFFGADDDNATLSKEQITVNSNINYDFYRAIPIKEVKSINKDVWFARLGERVDTLTVRLSYRNDKITPFLRETKIPLTVESLESLKSIKLK